MDKSEYLFNYIKEEMPLFLTVKMKGPRQELPG